MSPQLIRLAIDKNIRLSTIAARLATLCGKYLVYNSTVTEPEREVVEKGREYFRLVKEGLAYTRNWETRGLSFDPDTLKSLNALQEVFLVIEDDGKEVDSWINKIEMTLETLEGSKSANPQYVKETSDFFSRLSSVVKMSVYNPEVSHRL